jgi:hypothetical protein
MTYRWGGMEDIHVELISLKKVGCVFFKADD